MSTQVKRNIYEWILEAISFIALIFSFVPLFSANKLDEGAKIPIHFNASGEVDGWGDISDLWVLPIIGLVIYILSLAVEKYPKLGNHPFKITEENKDILNALMIKQARLLKPIILSYFAYMANISIAIAAGEVKGASSNITILFMVSIFVIAGIYLLKMYKAKNQSNTKT